MGISFNYAGISFRVRQARLHKQWLTSVIEHHSRQIGSVDYVFCDDAMILEINKQYLQHDYFTDIITFDYTEEGIVSGELYISIDTVRTHALDYKTGVYNELRRVMVHGVLHLLGYNDKNKSEIADMRMAEEKWLAHYEKHFKLRE
jgi:rRNA maturation RNase YbeY